MFTPLTLTTSCVARSSLIHFTVKHRKSEKVVRNRRVSVRRVASEFVSLWTVHQSAMWLLNHSSQSQITQGPWGETKPWAPIDPSFFFFFSISVRVISGRISSLSILCFSMLTWVAPKRSDGLLHACVAHFNIHFLFIFFQGPFWDAESAQSY